MPQGIDPKLPPGTKLPDHLKAKLTPSPPERSSLPLPRPRAETPSGHNRSAPARRWRRARAQGAGQAEGRAVQGHRRPRTDATTRWTGPGAPPAPATPEDTLFRPPDEPTDPRTKSLQAFAAVWERNIGPLDQTPEVKKALFDLASGANGLDLDLLDDKGNSVWDLLRKGDGSGMEFGDFMDGSGGNWKLPNFEMPSMKIGRLVRSDIADREGSSSSSWNWGSSSRPRAPSSGGSGFGSLGFGGSWFPVVVLAIIVLGIVFWVVWKNLRTPEPEVASIPHGLGPWPIDPRRINTREDVVKAFEYLSVLICGPSAKTWTHNTIADALAELAATHGETAVMLARLYELARYAPLDEPLTARGSDGSPGTGLRPRGGVVLMRLLGWLPALTTAGCSCSRHGVAGAQEAPAKQADRRWRAAEPSSSADCSTTRASSQSPKRELLESDPLRRRHPHQPGKPRTAPRFGDACRFDRLRAISASGSVLIATDSRLESLRRAGCWTEQWKVHNRRRSRRVRDGEHPFTARSSHCPYVVPIEYDEERAIHRIFKGLDTSRPILPPTLPGQGWSGDIRFPLARFPPDCHPSGFRRVHPERCPFRCRRRRAGQKYNERLPLIGDGRPQRLHQPDAARTEDRQPRTGLPRDRVPPGPRQAAEAMRFFDEGGKLIEHFDDLRQAYAKQNPCHCRRSISGRCRTNSPTWATPSSTACRRTTPTTA